MNYTVITASALPTVAILVSMWILVLKQNKLHDLMNSRLSELLKMTATASRAEGVESERQAGILRDHVA